MSSPKISPEILFEILTRLMRVSKKFNEIENFTIDLVLGTTKFNIKNNKLDIKITDFDNSTTTSYLLPIQERETIDKYNPYYDINMIFNFLYAFLKDNNLLNKFFIINISQIVVLIDGNILVLYVDYVYNLFEIFQVYFLHLIF